MKNYNYSKLKNELKKKPKILITTHKSPDGDAIGSSLALYQILKKLSHDVNLIVPNKYPSFLHWLSNNDKVIEFENNLEKSKIIIDEAELIFCLDFNDLSRTKMMRSQLEKSSAKFVMIDHHEDPSNFSDFTYSIPGISSTAQLIFDFINYMGWMTHMNKEIAECIYTGIVTDTGSFRFSSVDANTHIVVARLINFGLIPSVIHQKLFDKNRESRLKLLGYCLNKKMEIISSYHTAIISLSDIELEQFDYEKGDTESFVNYPLTIEKIVLTAFFVQDKDMIKISFRSKNKFRTNILSKKHFNGGGHVNASGGVYNGSLNKAIEKFKNILPDFKNELILNAKDC